MTIYVQLVIVLLVLLSMSSGHIRVDRTEQILEDDKRVTCVMDRVSFVTDGDQTEIFTSCTLSDEKIDDEKFSILRGELNQDTEAFEIANNTEAEFLIENIADTFPELKNYRTINCAVKKINSNHFKNLNALEVLELSNNGIESISKNAFKDLANLKILHLDQNNLKVVDPDWFTTLVNLEVLLIDENGITDLSSKTFEKLTNLREIYARRNKLTTLPAGLFASNFQLLIIALVDNEILTISTTMFDHLTKLWILDLRRNVCVDQRYDSISYLPIRNDLKKRCPQVSVKLNE